MVPARIFNMELMRQLITHVSVVHLLAFLGILGLLYVIGHFCVSLFRAVYSPYLGRFLGQTADLRKVGKWAVITGATDGIGKAYAEELARLGINVVLISRSLDKLKNVATSIASEFKVETKVIDVDFTGSPEIYDKINKGLEGLEIGILVNNVGMSYSYPEYLTQMPDGDQAVLKLINCNCVSCAMMCRLVLPQMVERGKGVVLNLSSGASLSPVPFLSVYGASKSFVDMLSLSLNLEYEDKGIIIQSVVPYYVTTNMSKVRKPTLFTPTPRDYVRAQLQTVGLENRTFGYPMHKIQGYCMEWVRTYIPKRIYHYYYYSMLKNMRQRYLNKKLKYNKQQ